MKAVYLIKTFAYECNRNLEGVDEKLAEDLAVHLKSLENCFSDVTVIAMSHSYSGQFVTFAVTLKQIHY